MLMIILSFHILVASIMTLSILGVFAAAHRRRETVAYTPMLISFAATATSGLGLLFVSPSGLGRLCAMMTAFTFLVIVARSYYRKRIVTVSSL